MLRGLKLPVPFLHRRRHPLVRVAHTLSSSRLLTQRTGALVGPAQDEICIRYPFEEGLVLYCFRLPRPILGIPRLVSFVQHPLKHVVFFF
jgi:hypothetical protein